MRLLWEEEAWEDYTFWQTQDKKTLKRINMLIKDMQRNIFEGIGKPEPLKGDLSGYWSKRIDDSNRIVYCLCEMIQSSLQAAKDIIAIKNRCYINVRE